MSVIKKLTAGLPKKIVLFTAATPLVMTGEVTMEAVIPLLMARIIDTGISQHNLPFVIKTGILMIGVSCFSLICGMLGGRFAAVASQGFSHHLRNRVFHAVQKFSFPNIDKFSTGSLVTRLTTDITNVQNVYQMLIRMCIRSPLMIISGIFLACSINLSLALIFVSMVPVLAAVLVFIALKAFPRFKLILKQYDFLNTIVQENLIAIRVVKSFVRGDFEIEKFEKSAASVRNSQIRAEKIVILNMPIMRLCVYICISAVLWRGGVMIIGGKLQVGQLISLVTYVIQVMTSLMMLSMVFVNLILSRASVDRICEVLDEVPAVKNPAEGSAYGSCNGNALCAVRDGSVDFENVSFAYTAPDCNVPSQANEKGGGAGTEQCRILKNINLHIPSGQFTGILGGTGSGKTTLVQLIPRLYDASSGVVKVGGADVKNYDTAALRNAVGVVLQKNVLFSGTIRDNLRWGNGNASDEELIAACKASDAHNFILSFPDGYNTVLEQGGVNVSGGQKQRLCIARALLKRPEILILDDSTSAVDTATERRIRQAVRSYLPETTFIIIAQRIASVQSADCIFVLDNGMINGSGTHEQLLLLNKLYKEVYESQQQGSGDADIPEESLLGEN